MANDRAASSGIADYTRVRLVTDLGAGREGTVPASSLRDGLQPLDATLTALAGLDASTGILVQTGADTFVKQNWITPWVAYTPTFTAFGTVSAVSIWSRRIGDTLFIRGRFTSGTSTAAEARMTLGFNGANGGITSDATKVASIQMAGPMTSTLAIAGAFNTLIESNVGYITFGIENASAGGMTKRNGDAVASSGNVLSLLAEIPITGW